VRVLDVGGCPAGRTPVGFLDVYTFPPPHATHNDADGHDTPDRPVFWVLACGAIRAGGAHNSAADAEPPNAKTATAPTNITNQRVVEVPHIPTGRPARAARLSNLAAFMPLELADRPRKRLGFAKPIEEIGPLLLR
jgi:hypothetical protein